MQQDVSKHPVQPHITMVPGVSWNGVERKEITGKHMDWTLSVIMQYKEHNALRARSELVNWENIPSPWVLTDPTVKQGKCCLL